MRHFFIYSYNPYASSNKVFGAIRPSNFVIKIPRKSKKFSKEFFSIPKKSGSFRRVGNIVCLEVLFLNFMWLFWDRKDNTIDLNHASEWLSN